MNDIDKTSLQFDLSIDHEDSPVGIYATRAPVRPNHIGLSLVEIVELQNDTLSVRGLDALNGTPILDIKPYPNWNRKEMQLVGEFRIPNWLSKILKRNHNRK